MTPGLQAVRGKNPPGMVHGLLAAKILVIAAIAAQTALPSGRTAAQTRAERGGHSINAAIEKVRRSPFHSRAGVERPAAIRPGGQHPAHSLHTYPSDSLPSFGQVFLPVIAATYLTDLLAGVVLLGVFLDERDIDRTKEVALILTVPVVVPALVAGGITGRYGHALLGSAFGTALALAGARSGSGPVALAVPAMHAALTTLFSHIVEQ